MHEPTIEQSQGGRRRQLPPALHLTRSRVELLLFSGAIAVLALHAAVDSFIAPEPGTGPGDHLLRGGVTLAVLSGSAYLYPRLPAGGRAAIAAVLGALALEGAVLAVSDARAVGARGEDWTGFLLFPVGLVLIVLAAVRLWRSRKPGRLRWLRRGALGFVTVVLAYWFVVPVAMAILATHRPRAAVEQASLGRPYEQVTLRTSDGLRLAGWYVRSRNGAAVISYPTRTGQAAAGADARPPRLRRAPARRARLRRQPGRPEPVRLGRRQRHRRRRRLAATAARRPRRPDRRDRLLGRRRDDAANRRRQHRATRRRLRRRRRSAQSAKSCCTDRAAGSRRCPSRRCRARRSP